jgi:hypothetical protein
MDDPRYRTAKVSKKVGSTTALLLKSHDGHQVCLKTLHRVLFSVTRMRARTLHHDDASGACCKGRLLLYEDYVWVSLGNAMKAKESKAT